MEPDPTATPIQMDTTAPTTGPVEVQPRAARRSTREHTAAAGSMQPTATLTQKGKRTRSTKESAIGNEVLDQDPPQPSQGRGRGRGSKKANTSG